MAAAIVVCAATGVSVQQNVLRTGADSINEPSSAGDADDPGPAAQALYQRPRMEIDQILGAPAGAGYGKCGRWRSYTQGPYVVKVRFAKNGQSSAVMIVRLANQTMSDMLPRIPSLYYEPSRPAIGHASDPPVE